MSTLHEQQRRFALHLFEHQNVQSTFLPLALKKNKSSGFSETQRLQIYRNNVAISLREALVAVYPVVQKLVGKEFFQQLAREYVQCHPSRTGNLHAFGSELAGFMEIFPGLHGLSYLPDVARLEWAYHRVFHTSEPRVLNVVELAGLDKTQSESLCFQISKSCVLLSSDFPVLDIWKANQQDTEQDKEQVIVSLDAGGVYLIVLRQAQQVVFIPLSAGRFALIESLAQGENFNQACDTALNAEADCDIDAALAFLVQQKIIVGFSCALENHTSKEVKE